jgi:SAM-dependent methyltransferase
VRRRGEHRVLRCLDCSFLTIRTGIDEARLGETYQDYLPPGPREIERWEREQRPVIRRAVALLHSIAPGRRLLEVGAGYGFFLAAARAAGFDTHGIEVSATGRRHARERFGLDLGAEPLERARLPDASFDVACAFYVIEHLPDPRAFLLEIARVLKPGGLILLRWPHTTPLARLADLFVSDHELYHPPWHLSDFAPATMERALRETGFERVTTRTLGGTAAGGIAGRALSRGAALLSEGLELATGARAHLPGVSKSTFGFRRLAMPGAT